MNHNLVVVYLVSTYAYAMHNTRVSIKMLAIICTKASIV